MANLLDYHFKRTRAEAKNEISLDRNMLALLAAVDEGKTLRQVMSEADMTYDAFKQSFYRLLNLHLIEKAENNGSYLNPAFISSARAVLVDMLGPLGETLVDDAASEMGIDLNRLPKSKASDLIEKVAELVPGNKESAAFKSIMENKMKGFNI